jgi:ferredoxin-NADP reductase
VADAEAPLTAAEVSQLNAAAAARDVRVAVVLTVRRGDQAALWVPLVAWARDLPWLSLRLHATADEGHRLPEGGVLPASVAWLREGAGACARAVSAYVCGPAGFFDAVGGALQRVGVRAEDLHTESFLF